MKNRLLILLLLVFTLLLVSCEKKEITLDEAKEVLPTLVESSKVLNEIYFGDGFKPLADASLEEMIGYYYADCSEYELYSISEIKDATEKVFTTGYADVLYDGVFDSIVDGNVILSPKYVEGTQGLMQSMSAVIYDLPVREYDFDTLSVVSTEKDRITLSLESEADGVRLRSEMILVRSKNLDGEYEYRLDSPTY